MPRRSASTQEVQWANELEAALRVLNASAPEKGIENEHIKLLSWIAAGIASGEPFVPTGFLRKKGWRGDGRGFFRAVRWFEKQVAARYGDSFEWKLVRVSTTGGVTNYAFHMLVPRTPSVRPQQQRGRSDVVVVENGETWLREGGGSSLILLVEQEDSTAPIDPASLSAAPVTGLLIGFTVGNAVVSPVSSPACGCSLTPIQPASADFTNATSGASGRNCIDDRRFLLAVSDDYREAVVRRDVESAQVARSASLPDPIVAEAIAEEPSPLEETTPSTTAPAHGGRGSRGSSRAGRIVDSLLGHAILGGIVFSTALVYNGLQCVEREVATLDAPSMTRLLGSARCLATKHCRHVPED